MFEQRVLYYLQQYLGKYVAGLDADALRISVLAGDVVLRNLQLKPEALSKLKLPITVKAGLLGSLKLKIPWRSLGQSPVIVELDSIYVLASPKTEADAAAGSAAEDEEDDPEAAAVERMRKAVDAKELDWVHHHLHEEKEDPAGKEGAGGGGFLRGMIDTVIGNLQLSITNVHIRYEDDVNVPGCPLAVGFTLQKLSAHTIDEAGKEVFVHKNALELLRKASELKRLSVYYDVHTELWKPDKPWADMKRDDWTALFQPGIAAASEGDSQPSHTYVLKPVDGRLNYIRRGRNVRKDESQAIQEADLKLQAISLHVSGEQYQTLQKITGNFATYAARARYWDRHPRVRPTDTKSTRKWWQYAGNIVREQFQPPITWAEVEKVGWMRRKYIPAYVECLQHNQMGGNEETKRMDEDLTEATILLFRRLAHTQVEGDKRKAAAAAAAQRQAAGGGWFGWFRGSPAAKPDESQEPAPDGELSEEEKQHLRQLVNEQEEALDIGSESPHSVRMKVTASIDSAAVVLDSEAGEVLRAAMENLVAGAHMYPKTVALDLELHAVGITSPEGTFLRSGAQFMHSSSLATRKHDVQEHSIEEGGGGEEDIGSERQRALQLGLVQNPQDGSADTAISLALSSSYITYSAATLTRLKEFFSTEEATDLSIVAAQAATQVERARNAVKKQAQQALSAKPKLRLHVTLDAPKVAVPIPEAPGGSEGPVTMVLDFGRFVFDSDAAALHRLTDEETAVYLPFQLGGQNLSAYLVDGDFSWSYMGEERLATILTDGGVVADGKAVVVPVLERCELDAALHLAKSQHPKLPPLRLGVTLPKLRFFISPARLHRVMRILHAALPSSGTEGDGPKALPLWRQNADREGEVSVLVWGGIGHATAQWQRRHAVLFRGSLNLLVAADSQQVLSAQPLRHDRRIAAVPPEDIGGIEHCIAVCGRDTDMSKVAEHSDALIMRFGSQAQAEGWQAAMKQSRAALEALAGRSNGEATSQEWESMSMSSSEGGAQAGAVDQKATMEIRASLGEFAIFVSGRVRDNWWPADSDGETLTSVSEEHVAIVNVDSERPLAVVRASGAKSDISLGSQHFGVGVAIGTFEIEDLLVGPKCRQHRYLARSYESLDTVQLPSDGQLAGDDEFHDAAEHLSRTNSARSSYSKLSSSSAYFDAPEDMPAPELSTGSPALPGRNAEEGEFQAWTLDFQTWKPDSVDYKGTDAEMSMKLTSFWFFCNRPTVGALIGLGADMAAATDTPEKQGALKEATPNGAEGAGAAQADEDSQQAEEIVREDSSKLLLEGGQQRTVFHLSIQMQHLEAVLNYETSDAPPLGSISVQDTGFELAVHPSSLVMSASLGNVNITDTTLLEDNPYCKACQPRDAEAASLIRLDIASHPAAEARADSGRVPAGLEYWSVDVRITQLEVVFLNRFLQEILGFISVTLALRPEPKERAVQQSQQQDNKAVTALESQAVARGLGTVLQLDVAMDAPVIVMPRSSESKDKLVADLGSLQLSNRVAWLGGAGRTAKELAEDPSTVLLDTTTLTMRGLSAKVDAAGHSGGNIIKEYDEGTKVVLKRPLRDVQQQLPITEVAVSLPSIKTSLSDTEYMLITSVAGANFSEPLRISDEARWMQAQHAPTAASAEDVLELEERSTSDKAMETPRSSAGSKAPSSKAGTANRTRIKAVVNIGRVEVEMMRNLPEHRTIEPLARFQVFDLWVSYHNTEGGVSSVSLSLPHVVGIDARPWVLEEHSLVISAGWYKPMTQKPAQQAASRKAGSTEQQQLAPSFATLHFTQHPGKAKLAVRLQQPNLVAEVGFMLAVIKFAYPSLPVSGVSPIPFRSTDVLLQAPVTAAEGDLFLSPQCRLLADAPACDDYIYDGAGHCIVLPEAIKPEEGLPLILVGAGKTLQLRNVTVLGAASLPACLHLGAGAQLIAHPGDNVERVDAAELSRLRSFPSPARGTPGRNSSDGGGKAFRSAVTKARAANALTGGALANPVEQAQQPANEFELELAALDVGLHFVEVESPNANADKAKMPAGSPEASPGRPSTSVRMLAAFFDASAGYHSGPGGSTASAALQGLRLESHIVLNSTEVEQKIASISQGRRRVQGRVLEPCQLTAQLKQGKGGNEVEVKLSMLRLNLSVDVLELMQSLQCSVLEPLVQPAADRPLARCANFVNVWSNVRPPREVSQALEAKLVGSAPGVTFWRPLPPIGYAVLGDCVMMGSAQPSFQALAVAVNSGLVDYPVGFSKVWGCEGLAIWQPKAPDNYAALGCVITIDGKQPPLSSVVCVHSQALVAAPLGSCFPLQPSAKASPPAGTDKAAAASIWCVNNAAATFMVADAGVDKPTDMALDLRSPLGIVPAALPGAGTPATRGAPKPMATPELQRSEGRRMSVDSVGSPSKHAISRPSPQFLSYRRYCRERNLGLRSDSSARLKVTSVDFRRIWLDKDTKDPSREGIGIWRPVPPSGYYALGDCVARGFDPPHHATVIQDADADSNHQLLRIPQGFQLVWADECIPQDKCLAIWKPVPMPGYVAMGVVCTIGARAPANNVIRCVRADAVRAADIPAARAFVKIRANRSRKGLALWLADERVGTFVVAQQGRSPGKGELWQMRMLHAHDEKVESSSAQTPPGGLNLVVKAEGARVIVRDVLRRPLMELELGDTLAVLRRLSPKVMQASLGLRSSLWSYNPMLTAWEPVIEPWDVIVKLDSNRSNEVQHATLPGTSLTVTSTSEAVHITLAYAAAAALMDAYLEWKDLRQGAREAYRRQLAAADSSSAYTIVQNQLGVAAHMELDHGDHTEEKELKPGEDQPLLQPMAVAPIRHTAGAATSTSVLPPRLFVVDIMSASRTAGAAAEGSSPKTDRQLLVSVQLSTDGQPRAADEWEVRTRAVSVTDQNSAAWDERLVLEASQLQGRATLTVELVENAVTIARGAVAFDKSFWRQTGLQTQQMTLQPAAHDEQEWSVQLAMGVQAERYKQEKEITDAWSADRSTAGERALRVGNSSWVQIAAAGRRSLSVSTITDSSSLVPVRVDSHNGVVLETSFQDGIRREALRSLAQLVNASDLPLEVAIVDTREEGQTPPAGATQALTPAGRSTAQPHCVEQVAVFENERFLPLRGWCSGNLLPTDRKRFSGPGGHNSTEFPVVTLEPGWEWEGAWEVETSGNVDKDGWSYAMNMPMLKYPPPSSAASKGFTDCVRRRRWVRRKRQVAAAADEASGSVTASSTGGKNHVLGIVQPHEKLALPYGFDAPGKQLLVRPCGGDEDTESHAWSEGASRGVHMVKLDSLADGQTRLVRCTSLSKRQSAGTQDSSKSTVWLSVTVDGDVFDEAERPALQPLTDWRIVVSPPLVIENTLPIAGSYIVWELPEEGAELVQRQGGQMDSGQRVHVYNADMRRRVALQFWPDGYEWAEKGPVTLADGFSGHAAGVSERQALPQSFRVRHGQSAQGIFLAREITNAWALSEKDGEAEEKAKDPGAAVALGAALWVRLLVPVWVVNATLLPISAIVLPHIRPPTPKTPPQAEAASPGDGLRSAGALISAANALANMHVLESGYEVKDRPVTRQELAAGSLDIISFPMGNLLQREQGDESRTSFGISFKVESSGWTKPMALERADMIHPGNGAPEELGQNKPVLLRASVPESHTVYEVVARMETVGGVFSRTMAIWLEPHFTVTNLTGMPLQLAQLAADPAVCDPVRRRKRDVLRSLGSGSQQSIASGSLSRAMLEQHSSAQRSSGSFSRGSSQHQPGSARSTRSNPADALDGSTCQTLPPGAANVPVHWSTAGAAAHAISLRITDDSDADKMWSAPLDASLHGGTICHLVLPTGRQDSSDAHGSDIDLHGPRVARGLQTAGRNNDDSSSAVLLRYSVRLRSPGCVAMVLEAVTPQAPYLLENRTRHLLKFRPLAAPDAPFQLLPPYAAAAFAHPSPATPAMVELKDAMREDSVSEAYLLDAPEGSPDSGDATAGTGHHGTGGGHLPPLPLSVDPGSARLVVADREVEAITAAGLKGVGASGGMGRHGLDRALRILPGRKAAWGDVQAIITDKSGDAFSVLITVGVADASIVDHAPEELLNITATGFRMEYATGIGVEGTYANFRVLCQNIQVDDQSPFTRYPVVLAATEEEIVTGEEANPEIEPPPVISFSVVSQPGLPRRQVYYPYIAWRLSRTLQVSVSETLIWRAMDLFRRLDVGRLSGKGDNTSAQTSSSDVPIQVKLVSLGDVQAKVSFRGDIASRPKWAARMLSWGLDLADFEGIPIRLTGLEVQDATMLWSRFIGEVRQVVQSQLLGVAFSFVRNFGMLSGASGIFGMLSTGVATIGMDSGFAQERIRQRQERNISGVREGLAEGGEALGMGFYRGVTGLVSKPLEGAQSRGALGFIKGVGQGVVGAVAAPVSGGLDLFSSAIEGLDASKERLLGRPRAGTLLARRRLPRAIGGEAKLQPFIRDGSETAARVEEVGQALLWLTSDEASRGLPFLGLRRSRGGRSEAYEEHFLLPDDRVALLTSKSMLLVIAPTFAQLHKAATAGRPVTDMRDVPPAVLKWRVRWDDLLALEPPPVSSSGPGGRAPASPDRLIVHRKGRPGMDGEPALAEQLHTYSTVPQGLAWCLDTPLAMCVLCCFPPAEGSAAAAAIAPPGAAALAHGLPVFNQSEAEQIKAVALRIAQKYYGEPRRINARWQRRHGALEAPQQLEGMPQQQMPASTLSMDWRLIWHTQQERPPVTVWRPVAPPGYAPLGDVLSIGFDPPNHPVRTYRRAWPEQGAGEEGEPRQRLDAPTKPPVDFHLVWRDNGRRPCTMWEPIAPRGYIALGTVVVGGVDAPDPSEVLCVSQASAKRGRLFDAPAWRFEPPLLNASMNLQRVKTYHPETWRCSLWQVDNAAHTFIAVRSAQHPPADAASDVTGELAA